MYFFSSSYPYIGASYQSLQVPDFLNDSIFIHFQGEIVAGTMSYKEEENNTCEI